jgi:hypothetical protein
MLSGMALFFGLPEARGAASLLGASDGVIVFVYLVAHFMLSCRHLPLAVAAPLLCMLTARAAAQQPIGELYATDASVKGSVLLAGSGTRVLAGSSIEAGAHAATLKLDRGGSLFVCEGTKLSINASQNGRQLLLSLNTGNLELNYPLGTEADTLLTPDLQLLLPGPGTVHVAVRVSPNGDTCVQSLPWNAAALVVSETMGDATYQVKQDEAVIFKGGHLGQALRSKQNCGCPRVTPPVQTAQAAPPPSAGSQPVTAAANLPPAATPPSAQSAENSATPPAEQHFTVEAPFIFHGDDPTPDLRQNVVMLKLDQKKFVTLEPTVLPPPGGKQKPAQTQTAQSQPPEKKESHGFFSKVGSFFASIFH